MKHDMNELLQAITGIARLAGDAVLRIYGEEFSVSLKADSSPLTQADLASHEVIQKALAKLTPEWPLLSEESAHIPAAVRQGWGTYWLVDPLDGTKEFVKRNGEFTVNIALIRDHVPVMGVVHTPVSGVTYAGVEGLGATRQDGDGERRAISVRIPATEPLTVVGSRSHPNPELAVRLEALGPHQLVSMGSSLKFCLVAEGEADLYPRLGPTSEWDTAAAQAVVEAAGGHVVTMDGKALRYNTHDGFLNPWFLVFGDQQPDWPSAFRDES